MITNLYRIRYDKGITQAELANRSGVGLSTIRAYEQGWRDVNKAELSILMSLAEVLEVPIYRLLEDRELANRLYNIERGGLL